MKWDSKTSITVGLALTLCSSVVIAVLAYQSTRHLIGASGWVAHTDEVLQELEAALGSTRLRAWEVMSLPCCSLILTHWPPINSSSGRQLPSKLLAISSWLA